MPEFVHLNFIRKFVNKGENMKNLMKSRFACRKFKNEKIDDKVINEILDLVRLSPSSFGLEPWKFVVISKEKDLEKLGEICNNQNHVKTCSHAIVVMARTDLQSKDKYLKDVISSKNKSKTADEFFNKIAAMTDNMSKENLYHYACLQCYIAVGNLVNIAYENDVKSCIIGGFDFNTLDKFINLGDDIKPCLVVALGKSDEVEETKTRMNFDNVVEWK